jgi:toxin ParE1/3/4
VSLRIVGEAENELREAMLYYEKRQQGLGARFLGRVLQTLVSIRRDPQRFPLYEGRHLARPFRRARISRFPYVVVFDLRPDEIVVIAVAHTSRKPGYWRNR